MSISRPPERRNTSARRQLLSVIIVALIVVQPVLFDAPRVAAQVTPTLGTPYTQNFDTLPASGSATWTNNSTIPGWFHARTGTGTTIVANNGSSNAGNLYSYGTGTATDRALGSVGSGNAAIGNLFWGVRLQNTTGATITQLDISYTGEQWRNSAAAAQTVAFSYLVGSPTVTGSLAEFQSAGVAVPQLDFTSPITGGAAAALDGNLAANRVTLTHSITGLNIPNGTEVMLRWSDPDHTGADHGLSIDDFSVTAQGTVSPTTTLSINDVTQAEGSGGGTTSFTFTVSLSAPAGPGGVTFDIATADGTAQDDNPATEDNDYVAKSLTGQTIPAGSSTYAFTVDVNADTTGEPNETFFVNVTNVTGATVNDGQGQGTINNDDVLITPIYTIQGSGTASPFATQNVTTTGIVTARRSLGASNNGFYIQDPTGDGNLNTSDAILVFTGSTVPTVGVGDSVQVTGTVTEFESSTTDEPDGVSPPDPKTATEITSPTTVVLSTGNTLPAALDVTSLNILDPTATSRGAQLEKYEYMRLSAASLVVSQPTNSFGEFWGVEPPRPRPFREAGIERGDPIPAADQGTFAGSPPPSVPVWDGNFERIMVDTGAALVATGSTRRTQVHVTTGTTVTGIVGPLDYAFDQYRIVLDFNVTPGTTGGVTAAVPVPVRTSQEFTVAHTNLENFSSSNATKMNKASLAIRNVLRTPDILGLIEVDTTASATALANKVNADAADPSNVNYVAHFGETSATQDIGYLINTARVTVVGTPTQHNPSATFTYCGVTDTLHDRPSFILEATVPQVGGGTIPVTVILNHTKSLIAVDSPRSFGSCGTGTEGARNREKRRLQAEDIADLIETRDNAGENLVVLGDLNAFEVNDGLTDVVNTMRGVPPPESEVVEPSVDTWTHVLTNLITKLTPDQRYSFTFEGNAQVLDHVLVNAQMLGRNNRFAYARFNADFSDSFASDSTRPEAVSDHDAPVAYFTTGAPQPSGSFIISEYRLRGPGGGDVVSPDGDFFTFGPGGDGGFNPAPPGGIEPMPEATPSTLPEDNDEFIEFYNNTDSAITVSTVDGSAGWSLVASDGVVRFTIPNGTIIPARGHYLATNTLGYTLTNYPGGNNGTNERVSDGDVTYATDITDGSGLAIFNTAEPANFNEATRLDAVGYSSNPSLYREGAGFNSDTPGAEIGGSVEYSFLRSLVSGTPKDTNDNNADFMGVETSATALTIGQNLGAPGPENLSSPIRRLNIFVDRLDGLVSQNNPPNRVRNLTPVPNGANGTLSIRRRVVNHTGGPVTRLRFRIIEITTFTNPPVPGQADVRALTSSDITVTKTSGEVVPVQGTVIEEPPLQPSGGGWNTSWSPTGTINLESPMPAGGSFYVHFLLGVQTGGSFRIFINVEALP
ncbi:MAG TPA: endonuclease/exonuclease/phosphatase family protein [Pyrinomonadaceae bacterium]|nr:endonuclease/exonuclease/phosphatase family protein [Pyrinomonadaceae bacterium]